MNEEALVARDNQSPEESARRLQEVTYALESLRDEFPSAVTEVESNRLGTIDAEIRLDGNLIVLHFDSMHRFGVENLTAAKPDTELWNHQYAWSGDTAEGAAKQVRKLLVECGSRTGQR